jgi:hypothetical protein
MKRLLAACTTALRAARLAHGGNSAQRHAPKRLRISNQPVVQKAGSVVLAAVLAVGMVGAAVVVPAASASNVVSDQNQASYWQALYPGSTCTKPVGELNVSTYKLPALPSGTDYVAVIVKAGSPNSVDVFNNVFDANSIPKPAAGVTVSTATGKNISHIIICTITPATPTVVTPVGPTVVQAPTCGGPGIVTLATTPHVTYVLTSFDSMTGDWKVTATPESAAYKFAPGVTGIFTGNAGANMGECTSTPTVVTPVGPTVVQDPGCGLYGTVTAADTVGVSYVVTFNKQTGDWKVTATPESAAYEFAGESQTATFTGNAGEYVECPTAPTAVVPTASSTAITCDAAGSYTLGAVEGVVYKVNGTVQQPGTYPVSAAGPVNVVAGLTSTNYEFKKGVTKVWNFELTEPSDCGQLITDALVTPVVSSVDRTCTVNGSYTLGMVDGVIYTANGTVQQPGTYQVSTAKTVNVVASLASTNFGFEEGAVPVRNLTFTDPKNCGELTTLALPGSNGTLAFTGSNGALAGGLLLGLMFVLFGAGVITVNRVNKRNS